MLNLLKFRTINLNMEHIWFYLQSVGLVPEAWVAILGPTGAILASAVIWLARENKLKDKALADLNETVRKDGLANMKIIDGLLSDLKIKYEHDKQTSDKLDRILQLLHHKEE